MCGSCTNSIEDFSISRYDTSGTYQGNALTILNSNGNIGIGTTSPDQLLSVNGNASKASGGTAWAVFSDIRLKDQINPYTIGLKEVLQINPITYRYKKDNRLNLKADEKEVGISAQELQKIIPDSVKKSSKDYLQFHMDYVNWAMVNSIKELNTTLNSERAKNKKLQSELLSLRNSIVERDTFTIRLEERLKAIETMQMAKK